MTDIPSIEARLAALEAEVVLQRDDREIRQLIASYGPLVDTAYNFERATKLAELWVEDGIYDIGGVGAKHGRAGIAEGFADQHFDMVPTGVCHVMGLPYIRISGDTAIALNYSCVFRAEGERFYPWRVSANRWDLVKQGGKWLVRIRKNRLMTGDADPLGMLTCIDGLLDENFPQ